MVEVEQLLLGALPGFVLGLVAHPLKAWADEQIARSRMRRAIERELATNFLLHLGVARLSCEKLLADFTSPEAEHRWNGIRGTLQELQFGVYDYYIAKDFPLLTSANTYYGWKAAYEWLRELATVIAGMDIPGDYESKKIFIRNTVFVTIQTKIDQIFAWAANGNIGIRLQRLAK